jgi:hypothetical protein
MVAAVTINVVNKGKAGEREVAAMLNGIVVEVMTAMAFPSDQIEAATKTVQRNQNQTAVGGCDLTNVFGMSVEVKRQEQLSIGTWWRQCTSAAERNNELPVLIFRQNRKPWRVRTYAWLALPGAAPGSWSRQRMIVAEFDIDTFKDWFAQWVRGKLEQGYEVKT